MLVSRVALECAKRSHNQQKKHDEQRGRAIQHALLTGAKPTKLIAVKRWTGNAGFDIA
jgi:hypothetical protein